MEKVYLVIGDTWSGDHCSTTIEGVYSTIEGANRRIQELVPSEKRWAAAAHDRTHNSLSEAEIEQLLNEKNIQYSLNTNSDGTLSFTIDDIENDTTTFLVVAERTVED